MCGSNKVSTLEGAQRYRYLDIRLIKERIKMMEKQAQKTVDVVLPGKVGKVLFLIQ